MSLKTVAYLSLALFFSPPSFASTQGWILKAGVYKGFGSIKELRSAKECSYDMKLTVGEAPDKELYIIRTMDFHDPIHCDYQAESHFVIRNLADQVYRVSINDYDADHGFCSSPNFCMHHLSYQDGSKVTEGIYEKDGNYIFTGMGTYSFGVEKTWTANLVKQR